ncbi:MAG TPA: toll/interleukin-1 receptor domain-containing protein [Chloroflexia bacterium]|nr:toll/interleukin-1 receptor domain-containing protein [Chloroflexia bacterium]
MANPKHLAILEQGVKAWNEWREENPDITPNLVEADLMGADLYGADFMGVDLTRADLTRADLGDAGLAEADLTEANLTDTRLSKARLIRATLVRASLIRATLIGVDLYTADLAEADLTGADLYGAILNGANLTKAYLNGANLTNANLNGAYLYEANLRRANLSNARLEEINLNSAIIGLTIFGAVDLSTAIGLDTINHMRPSTIGIDTLYLSKGNIPEGFLRGAGVLEEFITYIPALVNRPLEFYSCFISYSHADKSFARRLYDALQGRGIRCWLDEHEILPGEKIYTEVDRGIRIWDKVLLCCSRHSLRSWWVNNEVELAIQKEQSLWKEHGKEVLSLIPLDLDGYMFKPEWDSGWKGQITQRMAPDFTGWKRNNAKFETQFERVVAALRTGDAGRGAPPKPKL